MHFFDEFRRQLKYAARLLPKSPAFTATALLTLAVCFGANLTIFAVIDSVLLRPLPFPQPDRLVTVWRRTQSRANHSPFQFPANRDHYREYLIK